MEGPSLVILRKELSRFKGEHVLAVSGNSKIDQQRLVHQPLKNIKSWGKHLLLVFPKFFVRIHFLMFGSYRIDERKTTTPRLSLVLESGELNLYSCAITMIDGKPEDTYDWSKDIMSSKWNPIAARKKLKEQPTRSVSDALLDQDIFAGVGNIIKNEVLFRIRVHPESVVGALPPKKLTELIEEARNYSFDFYRWKRKFELRKHWLIYTKKKCPRCQLPVLQQYTGEGKRRSFFCEGCQVWYTL
jgi:endonuclease-8